MHQRAYNKHHTRAFGSRIVSQLSLYVPPPDPSSIDIAITLAMLCSQSIRSEEIRAPLRLSSDVMNGLVEA